MLKGTIKDKVEGKNFGFITPEDASQNGGKDVFFHMNSLVGITFEEIQKGTPVTFEIETVEKDGQTKTNAVNVQVAPKSEAAPVAA